MSNLLLSESESVPRGGRLHGGIAAIRGLSAAEKDGMFALLQRYFLATSRAAFEADLAEKTWVILLRDGSGEIQGFSTLMLLEVEVGGEPIVAFFSGDTIIDRDFWGETLLPRLWSRQVFRLAEAIPGRRAWWFLICSGYKTYRFLPLFFREYHPACDRPSSSPVRAILNALAGKKFPEEYDPIRGIVRLRTPAPLRPGVAEITPERLRDPHVAFFAAANPGWREGDELACLAEICRGNLTRAGERMLGEGR